VIYTFPLDEGAAVCGFESRGGRRALRRPGDGARRGVQAVRRRLEAGHGGFLLDEERADVFTASLGNLKPGSVVELSITYV